MVEGLVSGEMTLPGLQVALLAESSHGLSSVHMQRERSLVTSPSTNKISVL